MVLQVATDLKVTREILKKPLSISRSLTAEMVKLRTLSKLTSPTLPDESRMNVTSPVDSHSPVPLNNVPHEADTKILLTNVIVLNECDVTRGLALSCSIKQ